MALYIGLMSGTSMDGIDAALVDLPSNQLIAGLTKKYSYETQQVLDKVLIGDNLNLSSICQLNTLIGRDFAQASLELLEKSKTSAKDILAIGSHGQTVCHDISGSIPYTLQLGCAHTIAALTKITVVADFRTRDLVNGGQGAPFAPLYHQVLLGSAEVDVALVNLGGIANLTFISPNQDPKGWDIGPANCLLDAWIKEHQGKSYDNSGAWAAEGKIIVPLLDKLLSDPFLNLEPPKSIGKEYFSLNWLSTHLQAEYSPVDVQATLLALTAHSISDAIKKKNSIDKLYLCGGGVHNQFLLKSLAALLPHILVHKVEDLGWSSDYLEAMMFAWFASQAINHIPLNMKAITGSQHKDYLGVIYPVCS